MPERLFLDAAYAIALSSPNDQHNRRAVELAGEIEATGTKLITTRAVMLEIGNALSKRRYRPAAVRLLTALERDATVETISITDELYDSAFRLYRERPDKDWGMTDCISFIVMRDHNLMQALTTDEHFEQAGFVALLRDV